ncbi:MAG: NADH:ubiquinone oxidoreductase [Deltaproteobacteria bacterium]|nr:NADH:ubiquinone oxidoreductase [Deltaproteobacteria bacterium]
MKAKIGFFDFAGCEGCQLTVMNLEEELLQVLQLVEIVAFREVMGGSATAARLDIAFVEGSICRPGDRERLLKIRRRSEILVALGSCADNGGVNALGSDRTPEVLCQQVYGANLPHLYTEPPQPLAAVVTVDYRIPGCPIDGREFLATLQALLLHQQPELPSFSVCVECKLAEYPCSFDDGQICLGPITRAGCRAICVEGGSYCRGCRGLIDSPRTSPYHRILEEHGLSVEEILDQYRTFNVKEQPS